MKKIILSLLPVILISCNSGGSSSTPSGGGGIVSGGYTYTSQTNSGGVSCRHIGNTYQVSGTLSYSITGINPIAYIETSNSLPNIQISYDGNCTSSNASANPTCNITISGTNTESPVSIGVQINGSAGATPFPAGTITIPVCTSN